MDCVIERIKKEGFRRRLSQKTIKSYCFHVKKFLLFCKKDHKSITKKDVQDYIYHLSDNGASGSTLNVSLNSIKFMLDWVLFKRWKLYIKYSKRAKELPTVLTKEEVIKLFSTVQNPKHNLMLSLMYAAGLRVSELVSLRVRDLEISKGYGWVRHGKGNKDRVFIIAQKLRTALSDWITQEKLKYDSYLFKGNKGTHISPQTVFLVLKSAAKNAGILKNVHPHTLRHSFATHLTENGYDVGTLQSLLGHVDSGTTMQYIHMVQPKVLSVQSPFDSL